ncbi:MAG: cytochrome B6 [Bacteroidetes bacterium]|nr:MAG: cytochrome B6 [Bacteroidota bacterium]
MSRKAGEYENPASESGTADRRTRVRRVSQNFFLHIHAPRVHVHSLKPTFSFGLGIILAALFVIVILTGAVLMLYYTPSVDMAYRSVKDIIFILPGGRLIRNVHRWAAQGMVIVAFLHLIRVFYTASYADGRARNWVIGVVMLVLILLSNFSGYLLPWDQLAYWAVTIGANIASSTRELTDLLGITEYFDPGGFFKRMLIGGETVGQAALTRFFMLHVIFLPLTLLLLTGWHFWRIRKDGGLSRPLKCKTGESWLAWPVLMWTEAALFLVTLLTVFVLGLLFNAPLLEMADPLHPGNPAKSPWYFLGIQELVSYSAFTGGFLVPVLYLIFLFSIPFKDREKESIGLWFGSKPALGWVLWSALASALFVILQLFVMIRFGWLRDWFPGGSQWYIMLINPASLTALACILAGQLTLRRTRSTRIAVLVLFSAALAALIVFTLVGNVFRGPNWDFFWSPAAWPRL